MWWKLLIGLAAGGMAGYGWSAFVRCQGGSCPMTNRWQVAVLIGAAFGVYVALQFTTQAAPLTKSNTENGSMAQTIDSEGDFESKVLQADKPVLVDFYADWCAPCKALGPVIEDLAGEMSGKADVYKVDVDKLQGVAGKFGIQSIPTVIVFKDGQAVSTFVGVRGKEDYVEAIDKAAG